MTGTTPLEELEREGIVDDCAPLWIVNGFECRTPRSVGTRELEALSEVPGVVVVWPGSNEPWNGPWTRERTPPAGGAKVVMLTESFWQSRFGGDPDVVGSTLTLDDEAWTVIGVLPDEVGLATSRQAEGWRLFTGSSAEGSWGNHALSGAVGRLADGVTPSRAQAELERIMEAVPEENQHEHGASVFPLLEDMTRTARPALLVLLASAGLLLLVGCGNVAAILVGAGIDRENEIAVRSSLGASRGRLRRQLLTESVALAALGAVGGVLVALAVQQGLLYLAPPGLPRVASVSLDMRVLGFAVAVAALGGSCSGWFRR